MKILALDSTAKICTVALCEDRQRLNLKTVDAGMTHSETLLPMIESILDEAGIGVADIDMFALSQGPGSFTGVRIGAATVKGLCFGREKPCVGVSSLEALAYNYIDGDGIVVSAMDARRDQVYAAIFRVHGNRVERLCEDMALSVDELCGMCVAYSGEKIYICGDGAHLVYDRAQQNGAPMLEYNIDRAGQCAYSVALCAYEAFLRGEAVSDSELRPTYLRLAQAERERLERLASEKQ